jgi:GDP-4-dehydro-6-deoxy-D-mannose reductase
MVKIKALITGSEGFVGPYLRRELESNGYEVIGLNHSGNPEYKCDITDKYSLDKVILLTQPNCIFHLAGFSSPSKSFEQPELCFKVNVEGTRNLLDSASKLLNCKILIVSSSEVYGNPQSLPIDEKHLINPVSPYGKSRVEQEKIALTYRNTMIARSFNHTGPGQTTNFVIPSFLQQIKDAKDNGVIYVGNLNVVRDFSDVQDVVHAYRLLMEKANVGEVYNIGSGIGYNLKEVLTQLINKSGKNLRIEIDSTRFKKSEIEKLVCDNSKIMKLGATFRRLFLFD